MLAGFYCASEILRHFLRYVILSSYFPVTRFYLASSVEHMKPELFVPFPAPQDGHQWFGNNEIREFFHHNVFSHLKLLFTNKWHWKKR